MFSKARKVVHRVGAEATKVLFRIQLKRIVFHPDILDDHGGAISICFERGGKSASSSDYQIEKVLPDSCDVGMNEMLSLVSTLYSDSNVGNRIVYQSKKGKLILRQRKKSKFGGDTFKILGVVNLQLNELATDLNPHELSFILEKTAIPGAILSVIVSCRSLGQCKAGDETMSTMSGCSDMSFDFDYDDALIPSISEKDFDTPEREKKSFNTSPFYDPDNPILQLNNINLLRIKPTVTELDQLRSVSTPPTPGTVGGNGVGVVGMKQSSLHHTMKSPMKSTTNEFSPQNVIYDLKIENDTLKIEKSALCEEILNIKRTEEKYSNKITALETEMMTIKTAASNTDREMNTRLNAERSLNESLKQEIIMLKHKYDDAMIKEESNNKEKDMFNNTINDLRDKIRILEESANIEKSTRLTEDKSQKEMIEKCQSEIAKLNKENGAMRKEVETLRKENDKILKEKTAMEVTITEKEILIQSLSININEKKEIDESMCLQETQEDFVSNIDNNIELQLNQSYMDKLEKELAVASLLFQENLKEKSDIYEKNITVLKTEKDELNNKLLLATERIDELEKQMSLAQLSFEETLQVTTDTLMNRINVLEAEKENTVNEYVMATEKITELERQISLVRSSFEETLEATVNTFEKRIESENAEKEKTLNEYMIATEKLTKLEYQMSIVQSSFEETQNATKALYESDINLLNIKITDLQKEHTTSVENITTLENALSASKNSMEELVQELIAAKMLYANNVMDADRDRMKLFSFRRKNQFLSERVAALEVAAVLRDNLDISRR